jgi:hypothetical protein
VLLFYFSDADQTAYSNESSWTNEYAYVFGIYYAKLMYLILLKAMDALEIPSLSLSVSKPPTPTIGSS